MYSRWMGYSTGVKCTAFIPNLLGMAMFFTLITLYGRFPPNEVIPAACQYTKFCADISEPQNTLEQKNSETRFSSVYSGLLPYYVVGNFIKFHIIGSHFIYYHLNTIDREFNWTHKGPIQSRLI